MIVSASILRPQKDCYLKSKLSRSSETSFQAKTLNHRPRTLNVTVQERGTTFFSALLHHRGVSEQVPAGTVGMIFALDKKKKKNLTNNGRQNLKPSTEEEVANGSRSMFFLRLFTLCGQHVNLNLTTWVEKFLAGFSLSKTFFFFFTANSV